MVKKHDQAYRLYLNKFGIYQAYISFVDPKRGRIQLRETTGCRQLAKAEQYAINRIHQITQETQDANGLLSITIDAAFGRYFVEKGRYATKPIDIARRLQHIKETLNIQYLHELTGAKINEYIQTRRENVKNGTINRELAILSAVRNLAADIWNVQTNKANPQKFKLPIPSPQINFLKDKQCADRIIEKAPAHLKPIIYTALYTGLRRNNILNLKWANIDFTNNQITVKIKNKNIAGGKSLTIPMIAELKNILSNQPKINEFVFNYNGKPIKDIKHAWQSIFYDKNGKSTGIPYIRFHDLRHTAITWIVKKTGNILLAKEIVGHSSVKVTEIYAHVIDDEKRQALESTFSDI